VRQPREGGAPPGSSQGVLVLRRVEVVRTYLALDTPPQFRATTKQPSARDIGIERRLPCPVPLYRRLYKEVGEQWYWHDRLEWSDEELAAYLAKPNVGVWEVTASGGNKSAGYFELQRHEDGGVEIAFFGLKPEFIGQGLGGWMLGRAVEEAWAMDAKRVWLHTCTLDSDRALPNYLARGFRPYRTERLEVEIEGNEVVGERLLSN